MALPDNDWHVHSDGYRSDKEMSVDPERHAEEVLDEIENQIHPGNVEEATVEMGGDITVTVKDSRALDTLEEISMDYGCQIHYNGRATSASDFPIEARILVDY